MISSNAKLTYVDLSGFAFTGKSAFTDLLREFDGFKVPDSTFEFALLRTPHGLMDLENALVHDWSPVRSSEAIRQFKRLIKIYGGTRNFKSILTKYGYCYDTHFSNFTDISNDYVNKLVDSSFYGQWPFATDSLSSYEIFYRKVLRRLGYKKSFEHEIYVSAPSQEKFYSFTKEYLSRLLLSGVDTSIINTIVHNNSFEPFNSEKALKYFDDAKSIIIDRDPRDSYLSAIQYVSKDGKKGWTATSGKTVVDFVIRFKKLREKIVHTGNSRVINVKFEDLVLDYDNTCLKLYDFLGKSKNIHTSPLKYFNPELSRKNVMMWKKTDLVDEIKYIEKNLSEYCHDYFN